VSDCRATVVKAETSEEGISLRLWVDDERGRHLAVAEMDLSMSYLTALVRTVKEDLARKAQSALF
jgi:hypothetical protein